MSPADVVVSLGYADQAHLIRSVKRFMGQTPSQVHGRHWSASSALEPHPSRDQ
jgi:AraC-like DNA-binding protein